MSHNGFAAHNQGTTARRPVQSSFRTENRYAPTLFTICRNGPFTSPEYASYASNRVARQMRRRNDDVSGHARPCSRRDFHAPIAVPAGTLPGRNGSMAAIVGGGQTAQPLTADWSRALIGTSTERPIMPGTAPQGQETNRCLSSAYRARTRQATENDGLPHGQIRCPAILWTLH